MLWKMILSRGRIASRPGSSGYVFVCFGRAGRGSDSPFGCRALTRIGQFIAQVMLSLTSSWGRVSRWESGCRLVLQIFSPRWRLVLNIFSYRVCWRLKEPGAKNSFPTKGKHHFGRVMVYVSVIDGSCVGCGVVEDAGVRGGGTITIFSEERNWSTVPARIASWMRVTASKDVAFSM